MEKDPNTGGGGKSTKRVKPKRTKEDLPFKPEKPPFSFDIAKKKYGKAFEELGYQAMSKKRMKHIFTKHYPGGSKYLNNLTLGKRASVFNANENFVELALEVLKKGRNISPLEIVHDFGRIIGIDTGGKATSVARIVLHENKKMIRSFFPIEL